MKERLKASLRRWISFVVWALIFVLVAIWTRSAWFLLPVPFVFDLYITKFLPWFFWRNWKNSFWRTLMDWVDAIVFALVAVYFVFILLFQNYQIPSSSLEKTLLVGDFLVVNKAAYGPRMPMTPLHFPLAQHTMPIVGGKSYFEKPQWPYKRVAGLGQIERKDIVVFNFPTGDTVALKMQNPDYYTICYQIAQERDITYSQAADFVRSQPQVFGEIVWRPVDRRENYVKRCVGLPGDTLQIVDNQLYVNGAILEDEPGVQYNYFVQTKGGYISERQFADWGISKEDRLMLSDNNVLAQMMGFQPSAEGKQLPVYHFPATHEVIAKVRKAPNINAVKIEPAQLGPYELGGTIFPLHASNTWTRDNFGPLWIPAKGASIELNETNEILYGRAIRVYEGHDLQKRGGQYYLDGEPADSYTFEMDYYWMMGDNRHNSADSRAWGFVPEDHIVGRPEFVWLSLNKDKAWGQGKIRWNRFFKAAR